MDTGTSTRADGATVSRVFLILTLLGIAAIWTFFTTTNCFLIPQICLLFDKLLPDRPPPAVITIFGHDLWRPAFLTVGVLLVAKEMVVRKSRTRLWVNSTAFGLLVAVLTVYAMALAGAFILLARPMVEATLG